MADFAQEIGEDDVLEAGLPGTPVEVIDALKTLSRSPEVVRRALALAEEQLFRRYSGVGPALRAARWRAKLQPDVREDTVAWLKKLTRKALTGYHLEQVYDSRRCREMPDFLQGVEPGTAGFLVTDPESVNPSVGNFAYLEQTPPAIVRWVYETWRKHNKGRPKVWDLTAGSGTVSDILGGIMDCDVVATDLSPSYRQVRLGDAREVGRHPAQEKVVRGVEKPDLQIPAPDLVFLDPPSRGRPTHSEIYAGPHPYDDLALLNRSDWLGTVAYITATAAKSLAPGGYISVLVRQGSRHNGRVEHDFGLIADLKAALYDVAIVHEHPVLYGQARSQYSLGKARMPATHLLLGSQPGATP